MINTQLNVDVIPESGIPADKLSQNVYETIQKKIEDGDIDISGGDLALQLTTLRNDFDNLVKGDTTVAIKTFNEVIAFLNGIEDTQDLQSIIGSIQQEIGKKINESDLHKIATSGDYNDLDNKPTIPSAVTESTVSGWGFTKNTGTVTGVKINGTTKTPSNGTVDLGTVITSHQDISGKADDTSVVHKTGNETITGAKTFNSGVNFLGSGDSNAVTLSTNTRINVNGTNKTVLGFGSNSFYINHGDYDLLLRGKATRPTYNGADMAMLSDVNGKQDELVSGSTIKTINGESILGNGDITIEIPNEVTENTVSGWGFTKNTGTYSKPSGGIPKTDLASAVQTSLSKADTALQSYTEQYKGTITGVSANGTSVSTSGVANIPAASTSAYGVTKLTSAVNSTSTTLAATASAVKTAYDLANNYKGTVTGVKINGSTKNPSNGVVDLGTVITSHQDISGKQDELVSGTNIKTINGNSILGSGDINITDYPLNNEIWYTSSDGNIVTPYKTDIFGANIVSNTYSDGKGVIKFDGDVTSIGGSAFRYCSSLTSITIPNSVTSIGQSAFDSCTSLKNITISDNVTSIGWEAFFDCSSLASVTIGKGVTQIGIGAFNGCDSLISVYCKPTTPPTSPPTTFDYNASGRKFYVTAESIDAYKTASGWNNYTNDIVGCVFEDEHLVSGANIKTINGESILGSGNIVISGGSSDANVQAVDTGDVLDDVTVDYATTAYVDGLVGDINSVLESIINGGVSLITFTIDGTVCQAEEGMTFHDWAISDYYNANAGVCGTNGQPLNEFCAEYNKSEIEGQVAYNTGFIAYVPSIVITSIIQDGAIYDSKTGISGGYDN